MQEPDDGYPAIGDAEAFIDHMLREFGNAFPRTQLMSKGVLCFEFSRFVQSVSVDDLEARAHFQL
jgi:hypothetical protein